MPTRLYLHHPLLLGEVAVHLEVVFGRGFFCPHIEDSFLLLTRHEDSMEVTDELVHVWGEGGGRPEEEELREGVKMVNWCTDSGNICG